MHKSVVLLSGGLDSAVNLLAAANDSKVLLALTFAYGQKAAKKEIAAAKHLCQTFGVSHQVVELPWFADFTKTALIAAAKLIPGADDVGIDDAEKSRKTASAVWVPNRNGIFLNIAAGFAEGLGADTVVPGFNREEAATFPDNSGDFCHALNRSFSYSTANSIRVKCYTIDMDKTAIVAAALRLGVPLAQVWPCYQAYDQWCGVCESCQRFRRALQSNPVDWSDLHFDAHFAERSV